MTDPLKGLNEAQLLAAKTIGEHTTVLSCPGSGKTRVLEAKVSHILLSEPNSFVCCTTFSREGANEIRTRIVSSLPSHIKQEVEQPNSKRLVIGTFHALCYKAIFNHFKQKPNLVRISEKKYLLRKAAWAMGIKAKGEEFDNLVSIADSIPTMLPEKQAALDSQSVQFFEKYKQLLYATNKLDFDDLLVRTLELLDSGEMMPMPYTHLLCDESQDNDDLMRRWVYIHAHAGSKITMLLDDDQCLYSFRNALGVNICLDVENDLGAKRITNATNYRSHEEILSLAGKLIEKNQVRVPKALEAHRGKGGKKTFHHLFCQIDTVNLINKLIKPNPGHWFILCRTNADIMQIATYLMELGIPYKGPDATSLYEMEAVQAYIELVKTLVTFDGMGIEIILKLLGRTEDQIAPVESEYKNQISTCEFSKINTDHLPQKEKEQTTNFLKQLELWRDAFLEGRDSSALRQSNSWLTKNLPSVNGIDALESIFRIIQKLKGSTKRKLADLQSMFSKPKEDNDEGKVVVMTAHSSKGLQRKSVLIWNLRDGCYPTIPRESDDPDLHIEEERRILYVAMTRAEDELHLVYQSKKITESSETIFAPSPFLHDMSIEIGEPVEIKDTTTKNVAYEVDMLETNS